MLPTFVKSDIAEFMVVLIDTLPFAVCVTEPVTAPANEKSELSKTKSKVLSASS